MALFYRLIIEAFIWAGMNGVLGHIKKNGEIMARASGQYEKVPDAVKMANPFIESVEEQSEGIKATAQEEPDETSGRQRLQQRVQRDQDEPAHDQVNDHLQDSEPFSVQGVHYDANGRQSPDDGKDRPAPCTTKSNQGKRRIGAGNQRIDGEVVEFAHDLFRPAAHTVEKRRNRQGQKQSNTIDSQAHDLPRIALLRGSHDQYDQADSCEYRANNMADAVKSFAVIHQRDSWPA